MNSDSRLAKLLAGGVFLILLSIFTLGLYDQSRARDFAQQRQVAEKPSDIVLPQLARMTESEDWVGLSAISMPIETDA